MVVAYTFPYWIKVGTAIVLSSVKTAYLIQDKPFFFIQKRSLQCIPLKANRY